MSDAAYLDPKSLLSVEFQEVRRGYRPDQVTHVLNQAATALEAAQQHMASLQKEVEAARDVPPPSLDDIDDNELMLRLGDKTVQVLEAARQSAADVERRTQEQVDEQLKRAKDDSHRLQAQAEKVMRAAQHRVTQLEQEAERKARDIRQAAEAHADAATVKAEETLRTARADTNALEAEATARADRVNSDASEAAARAKAKVDALITATRKDVETTRGAAEAENARMRHDAEQSVENLLAQSTESVERLRASADADADRVATQATARYEERVAAGREQGRKLIAEALDKRAELLHELASVRRRALLNIEQLRVGREQLLGTFEVASATIEQATGALDDALPEAKEVAERLVARVGDDEERSLDDLEAEFALERLGDLRILSDDDDPEATLARAEAAAAADKAQPESNEDSADEAAADPADGPEGADGEAPDDEVIDLREATTQAETPVGTRGGTGD